MHGAHDSEWAQSRIDAVVVVVVVVGHDFVKGAPSQWIAQSQSKFATRARVSL